MCFTFRKIIKYLLLPYGIICTALMKKKNRIIILMYHRVNDTVSKEMSVTQNNFYWQMEYLRNKNYNVISMNEAYDRIKAKKILDDYVVLTFDDGYEDYYLNSYPVLKANNFPSIIYLAPGFIGTQRVYWWDIDIGESRLMSWNQICELNLDSIVDVGCHTFNHYDMNKLESEQLEYELKISKNVLENKLGREINHFSYPRGIYSSASKKLIMSLYKTGALIFNGKEVVENFNISHLAELKRVPVQHSDGKYLFIARIRGWLVLEDIIRKLLNKHS